ncbi:hypothetical protein [Pseudonocardia parietis]|uniref:ER-bound oxygenase mpaB/mpaB'/Rubber oxygenase catalytic domain-containing protein n=1 Tax=Pseudonocardia parietis TaxID=570936 RepID=A0ABS4VV90_9PSEU|nr:hypothetical protein [Pseudonocardia parietis]MBP2367831.1 hypothetical protein [Pseudonocardia parietis]
MGFTRWLRENSEHYLMVGAHEQLARRYPGTRRPRPPHGPVELLWLRVFAPVYRTLPWPLRHRILRAMPGSHRRSWTEPPRPSGPAV